MCQEKECAHAGNEIFDYGIYTVVRIKQWRSNPCAHQAMA
jgi:hypothetical protein